MVTRAEFIEQVVVSGFIMAAALGVMAYVRFRYDVDHKVFRRRSIAWAVSVGLVMLLSVTAEVTETRCTQNPAEFCRYNDNVPFIALLVIVFVCMTLVRSFFMHFNR